MPTERFLLLPTSARRRRSRLPAATLLFFLILLLTPNASSVGGLGEVRTAAEASDLDSELVEGLNSWLEEEAVVDVPRRMRERARSFEVLVSYHDHEARVGRLAQIPFGSEIIEAAQRHGLDPLLVAAVVEVESSFRPAALSHRGAVGLMQVLPSTARATADALRDPQINLDRGAAYLRHLLERFGGDLELALAAYNAGPTAVRRHAGVPPYRETRNYVHKVLRRYVEHHRDVWHTSEMAPFLS
ncbi:MAG: lytic transglycosylase domain-containing protein [Acidobacteriota bacterium]